MQKVWATETSKRSNLGNNVIKYISPNQGTQIFVLLNIEKAKKVPISLRERVSLNGLTFE